MNKHIVLLALLLSFAGSACATTGGANQGTRRNSSVISAEEIAAANVATALDLVEELRPGWLRTRGQISILLSAPIRVYVDGAPHATVAGLRQINAAAVERMQRLSATEATQRFGTDHANGAILVFTR